MRGVAIVLLAVVIGIGVGAYALLRDDAKEPGSGERAASSNETSVADGAAEPANADAPAAAREHDTSEGEEKTSADEFDEFADYRGDGSITLRIVDAQDDSPLADLPFVVYSERPRMHVFTRGVTDGNGEASIAKLPEDVVIFETPRRPPHANMIWATWLKSRERKTIVMRVGRGGTVHGRVLDDLGRPLEGVELELDPRPGGAMLADMEAVQAVDPETTKRFEESRVLVTTSDAAGHYEVAAVRSRPASIWIEDGEMSPKRETELRLHLRWQLQHQSLTFNVGDGETKELPDVVMDRARTYAGRVVDTDGSSIAGALVSTRSGRRYQLGERAFDAPFFTDRPENSRRSREGIRFDLAPWEEGFALAREEAVTAVDGTFELTCSLRDPDEDAFVAARDGRQKDFPLPKASPGARVEGLEFRLPAVTQLLLDVTDADGAPLPAMRRDDLFPLQLRTTGVAGDGREIHGALRRAGPTSYGVSFELAPSSLAKLVLSTDEHHSTTHDFASPPIGRPTLHFTLERKASFPLEFRFRFSDEQERKLIGSRSLVLNAMPLDAQLDQDVTVNAHWWPVASAFLKPETSLEVTLHVPAPLPWKVVLHGPFGASDDGVGHVELGTFEPDGKVHEIVLPRAGDAWLAAQARRKAQQEGGGTPAIEKPKAGVVGAVLIDAATNAPIDSVRVRFVNESARTDGKAESWSASTRELLGASYHYVALSPGDYALRITATGYHDSRPLNATIASGKPTDLGRVLLEPLACRRLRLLQRDGEAAGGWFLRCANPDSGGHLRAADPWDFELKTAADGTATLRGELDGPQQLFAFPPDFQRWSGGQLPARFDLASWNEGETRELTLPAFRKCTLAIDVSALESAVAQSTCWVELDDADTGLVEAAYARPSAVPRAGHRMFTFTAPPGRYSLAARGPLLAAPVTTIELLDTDELQEITLVATLR